MAKKQTTALPAGSTFLYGDREFAWHHREKASEYVILYLDPDYAKQIAIENDLSEETQLTHRVIFPDPTITQVAHWCKGELLNEGLGGNLFAQSLKNLLTVIACLKIQNQTLMRDNLIGATPLSGDDMFNSLNLCFISQDGLKDF